MDDAPIDLATFRSLEEAAGAEFVAELAQTFQEEAPVMLNALRDALTASDPDSFRRAAHSLKSNSLTFGAEQLAGIARDLERDAARIVAQRQTGPLDALAAEYARVAATLTRLRHA